MVSVNKVPNYILQNNLLMQQNEDGDLNFEADKLATKTYFLENINKRTQFFHSVEERIKYLIDHKYYVDFLRHYSMEFIKRATETAYTYKFRFKSYMAASKFFESYALKDDEGKNFLERYEDRVVACALHMGLGNETRVMEYIHVMITQQYQPATPTFLNAGKKRSGQLVSCFLDNISDDLNGIGYAVNSAMKLSSMGGGVAFNMNNVRSRGEAIKGVDGRAGGVLPVAKILEDTFSYANQLGQRPGAGAIYISALHADIMDFLDSKKINADEKSRLKSLSIGVIVEDVVFRLAKEDMLMYTFMPHNVFMETGVKFDDMDMDEWYHKLVENPRIKKTQINPRHLLVKIAQIQKESGYPYIFYKDNANRDNPLKYLGQVKFTNLCTEIMQISTESQIDTFGSGMHKYGYGISCNLGSLNIAEVMKNKNIVKPVNIAMRALTAVTDMTNIKEVPSIARANDDFHSVGLGAMNLHGYLAKNLIAYDSPEGREFADKFFMAVNWASIITSIQIAREKGETFKGFKRTTYAEGSYFDYYTGENTYAGVSTVAPKYYEHSFKSPKVARLFEGMTLPTVENWKMVKELVMKYGMYHSYRMAIAPNQSTGYIMNATPSISPIVEQIETREFGNSKTYYPMPFLDNINKFFFKSAYDMKQEDVIDMAATIQPHIDQGISLILHTSTDTNTRDLAKLYIYGWMKGLKSLYYTRTRKLNATECISCSA